MAWWNRSRRSVDIDALAPEDRAWLEQEADRIAVDPVTFVRMLIRRNRMDATTAQRGIVDPLPGATIAARMEYHASAAERRELEEKFAHGAPDGSADIDVEALLATELANAEQVVIPQSAGNGAVQVLGGRPPAPFHIPRQMG